MGVKAIVEKDTILFKHNIPGYDVCDFFHDFNDAVSSGEFDKIDYNIWKTFKKLAFSRSSDGINVEVKYDRKWRIHDLVITLFDEKESFTVVYDDDSLGTFLCEHLAIPIIEAYCIDHGIQCFNEDGFRLPIDTIMESVIQYFDNTKEILIGEFDEYCQEGSGEIAYKYTDSDLLWTTASSTAGQIYCNDLSCSTTTLNETINSCLKEIDNLKLEMALKEDKKITINNTNKENKNMNMFNFDFGPVNSNSVRMSMYGLAVKNKDGKYVSYNASTDEIVDVDILNFDGAKFLYKIPVAIKDVAIGDIVIHQRAPMFVVSIGDGGKTLGVIDPVNGEKKEIMLTKSPFGFNFATKVVNFIAGAFNASNVSAENPFGNMWMLAMLGDSKDMNDLLPLMMLSGGNLGGDMNAMLPFLLMGDSNSSMKDILPMMMFANMNKAAPCNCGHCKGE